MPTSSTLVLDADWSKGIIRDAPRGSIPQGGLYDSVDYLLHKPGIAQKRGGTTFFGPTLGGTATYIVSVGYAPFSTGSQVLAIGDNGHLYKLTSSTSTDVATLGSAFAPTTTYDGPKFRVGASKELLVFPANDGTTKPKYWNGTAAADLAATAPAGKYLAVYKTRLVVAGTAANPDRLFFSPVPDITSGWDTTNSWIDTDFAVTGLAALQNALIIFSAGKTQRITGTTPPPQTDMDRAPIGDVGCTDPRSIVIYEGRVIFANPRGVYTTDGVTYRCLTRDAGIESMWRNEFEVGGADPGLITAGVLGSNLIINLRALGSGPSVDTLICNLARNAWGRLNITGSRMFASAVGVTDELYSADTAGAARVTRFSGLLSPSADNKQDASGVSVQPVLETRMLGAGPTLKHFGFGHVSMDMRDAASDNPTMAVSFAAGLESTAFSACPESPLAETTDETRYRFTVGKVTQGGTLRFAQSGPSSKTELYALELETLALKFQSGGQ